MLKSLGRIEKTYINETLVARNEVFCANTEALCIAEETNDIFDNHFYRMSTYDNMVIFDIAENESVKIPHMTLAQLNHILFKKLKVNKACDLFKLTVEHIRHVGDDTLIHLVLNKAGINPVIIIKFTLPHC